MPTLSDAIATGVRVERARRRWTQTELAEKSGIARSTIGEIETGRRKVTADYLPALCKAFGVSLDVLAAGADPGDLQAMGF